MFFLPLLAAGAGAGAGAAAAGTAAGGIGASLLSKLLGSAPNRAVRAAAPFAGGAMTVAPNAASGVMDAIRERPSLLGGAAKDFLIGDNPLKTFLGTAPVGSSQGILPAAMGNLGIKYTTSRGQTIGPIRPIGPNGLLGGFNRSLDRVRARQVRPVRILQPGDENESVLRGYSNILGGYRNA